MSKDIEKTYKTLLSIRNKKDLKLNYNPYLNENYQLRYYQIIGMLHMFMVKRFILGDDCGLGKSFETIAAYATVKNKNPEVKLMIICPSSVMYQWASEINKFCNNVTSQIVEATEIKYIDGVKLKSKNYLLGQEARKYQFDLWEKNNSDVVIFNYNTLGSDFEIISNLVKKNKFMVIFDECTSFKNTKTMTHENARQLSLISDRVYGLSATIIKNDLLEAYAIFRVIMPYVFGPESTFKKNYCIIEKKQLWKGKGTRGKVVNQIKGYKNLDHFKKAIDPYYLGRKKSDVAKELPEIVSREIYVKMNSDQEVLYNDALQGFIDYEKFNFEKIKKLMNDEEDTFEEKDQKQIDKLTALIYCQQIVNSPKTIDIDVNSNKEEELLRIIKQELYKEKVVIYTRFKKMVNRIEKLINEQLKVPVLKITGDIDNKVREEYKIKFNTSEDHNIMIINAAAREGINLQSSGYLIFYDLPFSYGDFLQIIGRIHRIGSTHEKVFLLYLMCKDTVDEKVYQILSSKKELFDKVLGDSAVGAMKEQSKATINDLFSIMLNHAKNKLT
jgi:SNF2 family DNA or RNA helicase